MTIDERLEFLVQSTESLHATVHEMSGQLQEIAGQVQEVTGQVQTLTGQVGTLVEAMKVAGENIRGLTIIAQRHENRLDALDGGAGE